MQETDDTGEMVEDTGYQIPRSLDLIYNDCMQETDDTGEMVGDTGYQIPRSTDLMASCKRLAQGKGLRTQNIIDLGLLSDTAVTIFIEFYVLPFMTRLARNCSNFLQINQCRFWILQLCQKISSLDKTFSYKGSLEDG